MRRSRYAAVQVRGGPGGVVAQICARGPGYRRHQLLVGGLAAVPLGRVVGDDFGEPVAFQIGLVHDPQPNLIGQAVEGRVRRVVGAAQRVDVVLLHEHEVAPDELGRYGTAESRVVIVAVHAPEPDGLAVDLDQPVLEFHRSEAGSMSDARGLAS